MLVVHKSASLHLQTENITSCSMCINVYFHIQRAIGASLFACQFHKIESDLWMSTVFFFLGGKVGNYLSSEKKSHENFIYFLQKVHVLAKYQCNTLGGITL